MGFDDSIEYNASSFVLEVCFLAGYNVIIISLLNTFAEAKISYIMPKLKKTIFLITFGVK